MSTAKSIPGSISSPAIEAGQMFGSMKVSGQSYRIYAINAKGEGYRLSNEIFEQIIAYCREDYTNRPASGPEKRVYSQQMAQQKNDAQLQAIFQQVTTTNQGTYALSELPSMNAPILPASAMPTRPHYQYKIPRASDPFFSTNKKGGSVSPNASNNRPKPEVNLTKHYGITGLQRPKGYQICWALSALQTGVLVNPRLTQEVTQVTKKNTPDNQNELTSSVEGLRKAFKQKHQGTIDVTELAKPIVAYLKSAMATPAFSDTFTNDALAELVEHFSKVQTQTLISQHVLANDTSLQYLVGIVEKRLQNIEKLQALVRIQEAYAKNAGGVVDISQDIRILFANLIRIDDLLGDSQTTADKILGMQFSTAEMLEGLFTFLKNMGVPTDYFQTMIYEMEGNQVTDHWALATIVPVNLYPHKDLPEGQTLRLENLLQEQRSFQTFPDHLHIKVYREFNEFVPSKSVNLSGQNVQGGKTSTPQFQKTYIPHPVTIDATVKISQYACTEQGQRSDVIQQENNYELIAFSVHGNMRGETQNKAGVCTACHYVSYVKKTVQGKSQWFFINDYRVVPIQEKEALTAASKGTTFHFKKISA